MVTVAPSLLSLLTGSFSSPAADNRTVAMVESAYVHHGLAARYLNWRITRRVNAEDTELITRVQLGMQSKGFRGGFYAPMEYPSLDIRRYLERHLGDLTGV